MSKPLGEMTSSSVARMEDGASARRADAPEAPAAAPAGMRSAFAACLDREIEEALLKRARKGDTTAYGRLMGAYQERLYSLSFRLLANREDAEEAVQDAFVKAWHSLGKFHGKSSFYTWIYRIAVNASLNRLAHEKRRGRGKTLDLDEILHPEDGGTPRELPDPGPNPLERANQMNLEAVIQHEVARLPGDLRVVVVLRDIEGMAYETISESINLPLGTVKSRLHKARTRLQEALRPYMGE